MTTSIASISIGRPDMEPLVVTPHPAFTYNPPTTMTSFTGNPPFDPLSADIECVDECDLSAEELTALENALHDPSPRMTLDSLRRKLDPA